MNGETKRKPWAVLAYTVADDRSSGDSLDDPAKEELRSLCNAADFGTVSIAAQVDFKSTRGVFRGVLTEPPPKTRGFETIPAASHPLWRGIKARLERAKLRVLKDATDLNAARGLVLKNFLRFGQTECPADRYVVFFYGHGFGPLGLFFDKDAGKDAETLQMEDLARSLDSVEGRAAVIVFRACMANTLETAYQLKDAGEFMIASQSIVPIAGVWPWDSFLKALQPAASSHEVAETIAARIADFLDTPMNRKPFADVPYSLVDLSAAAEVGGPLKALASALDAARANRKASSACIRALDRARIGFPGDPAMPGDPALLDVSTMCEELIKSGVETMGEPARSLAKVVDTRLVRWNRSQLGHHRGIALFYKPTKPEHIKRSHIFDEGMAEIDDPHYRALSLSRETGWDRVALNPLI